MAAGASVNYYNTLSLLFVVMDLTAPCYTLFFHSSRNSGKLQVDHAGGSFFQYILKMVVETTPPPSKKKTTILWYKNRNEG
jgi:hypothetical protein